MESRARIGHARVYALRVLAITALALLPPRLAYADKIDDLIDDLDNSSDRVRISAVLALTSQASPRSIDALAKTVNNKSEQSKIRGLAAAALGKIVVSGNPSAGQKQTAIKALDAASNDSDPFVSSKASAARSQIGGSAGTGPSTPSGGYNGVYVNVGPMSSKTGSAADPTFRASMEKTAKSTLGRIAPTYQQTWPGGTPSKAQLQQKKIAGFYVDGTLNAVTVTKSGNSATISCKVSMLLADFPDKNMFGFLNGGANVQGSASQKDIDLATQDCVQAVMESLITKQIVPTIKTKI